MTCIHLRWRRANEPTSCCSLDLRCRKLLLVLPIRRCIKSRPQPEVTTQLIFIDITRVLRGPSGLHNGLITNGCHSRGRSLSDRPSALHSLHFRRSLLLSSHLIAHDVTALHSLHFRRGLLLHLHLTPCYLAAACSVYCINIADVSRLLELWILLLHLCRNRRWR